MRLVENARSSERQLLATFHEHARRKRHAVVVLSPTVVFSNPIAVDLVSADDHVKLRALTDGMRSPNRIERPLTLSSGADVVIQARTISGTDGVLCEVVPRRSGPVRHTPRQLPASKNGTSTLIVGEPGTGRSRLAAELAGANAYHVSCLDSVTDDGWLPVVLALLTAGAEQTIVLDDVHVLGRRDAAALTPALRNSASRVIMTTSGARNPSPSLPH